MKGTDMKLTKNSRYGDMVELGGEKFKVLRIVHLEAHLNDEVGLLVENSDGIDDIMIGRGDYFKIPGGEGFKVLRIFPLFPHSNDEVGVMVENSDGITEIMISGGDSWSTSANWTHILARLWSNWMRELGALMKPPREGELR